MKKLLLLSILLLALTACSSTIPDADAKKLPKKKVSTQKQIPKKSLSAKSLKKLVMKLSSSAFSAGGTIPSKYTCDGENISPPLSWSDVPENTKSLVLIHDDPDAVPVAGYVWDHWILYNIRPETRGIAEGKSVGTEATTSFGTAKYGGPCPPNGEHKYLFKLYALDVMLNLKNPRGKKDIEAGMKGHVLGEAQFIGKYNRIKK